MPGWRAGLAGCCPVPVSGGDGPYSRYWAYHWRTYRSWYAGTDLLGKRSLTNTACELLNERRPFCRKASSRFHHRGTLLNSFTPGNMERFVRFHRNAICLGVTHRSRLQIHAVLTLFFCSFIRTNDMSATRHLSSVPAPVSVWFDTTSGQSYPNTSPAATSKPDPRLSPRQISSSGSAW